MSGRRRRRRRRPRPELGGCKSSTVAVTSTPPTVVSSVVGPGDLPGDLPGQLSGSSSSSIGPSRHRHHRSGSGGGGGGSVSKWRWKHVIPYSAAATCGCIGRGKDTTSWTIITDDDDEEEEDEDVELFDDKAAATHHPTHSTNDEEEEDEEVSYLALTVFNFFINKQTHHETAQENPKFNFSSFNFQILSVMFSLFAIMMYS